MVKWIGIMALAIHFTLAAVCFLTMDYDIGKGNVRHILNVTIDAYEFVGFGELALGVLMMTLFLAGLAWWLWRRTGRGQGT